MPTIQGTDGDTTGALITTATTATELTALIEAATSANSGAMSTDDFDKLATVLAGSSLVQLLYTPVIDLTQNVTGVSFSPVAQRAGYYFLPERSLLFYKTLSGTFSTAWIFQAGNNAGQNNVVVATTISAASLNLSITTPGPPTALNAAVSTPAAGNVYIDAGTEITYKHTGATGTNVVATGRVVLIGAWVPVA